MSEQYSAEIHVPSIAKDEDLKVEISRDDFEDIYSENAEKIEELLELALQEAGLDKDDIHEVVLVGGSTRMPWVRAWLIE